MIIEKISESGLFNLFKEIISIDNYYAGKGKSDQTNDLDGRVRLGNNVSALLDSISVSIKLKDLTLFDLYTLSQMTQFFDYSFDGIGFNTFGNSIDINEYPDIKHYINETKSVINPIDVKEMGLKEKDSFFPIGLFKYTAIIHFRGMNILSLFDGFMEKFIYANIKLDNNKVSEESVKITYQTIYKKIMDLFLQISYKNANKSSLIEDFIINKDVYSYVQNSYEKDRIISPYKIVCPGSSVTFFGVTDTNKLIDDINGFREYANTIESSDNDFYFYFGCSTSIKYFLELYTLLDSYTMESKIVDHQKFDILFSDTDYRLHIPSKIEKTYGTRINLMLNHNTESRNLIMAGKKVNVANHPANKYGLIISGQRIKFILRINLKDIKNLDKKRKDYGTQMFEGNRTKELLYEAVDLSKSIWKHIFNLSYSI